MKARPLAAGVVFGIGSSACILVMSFDDVSSAHCQFEGAETACGQCLATRCAAPIDGCCLDSACGGVVADVEACARGPGDACARLSDGADRSGVHSDLSQCVVSKCAEVCGIPSKVNLTHCERAYVTSLETCRCEVGDLSNDTPCTEIGHPLLRCCAPKGWPAADRSCECKRINCSSLGPACICQLSAVDERDPQSTCAGETCCADLTRGSCTCSTAPCSDTERQVASCTIDELSCPSGTHHVDSCTVPK